MSLIVRQRVGMHDESLTHSLQSKNIFKKKQSSSKCHQKKKLICLVSVPKSFKEHVYIKSNVELKLALSFNPDNCLGALKETPCTYNYRVSRTDQLDDVYFYTLELLDQPNYSIDQIIHLLSHKQDSHAIKAAELVQERHKILQEYTLQPYISNEDLLEVEKIAQEYPYQCTIQKVNKDSSSLSQRIVNEQFYNLMGVSREMMLNHLHETKTFPSIFDLGPSLKLWCDLSSNSIQQFQSFETYINTYEGAQYKCTIEQRQMFKRTQVNPNQIVFIEFWLFKVDEPLKSFLMNPQRIYQNQIDYFNKKNTQKEYEAFLQSMKYKQTPLYKNKNPCGYKELTWI
ncbi:unnamed protein product [Paramecium pentaurelia]|uniref:Uncharacterized protein n=1 Tax=Paramecium pentaurelia TaxID=43138 RepID=A0A8S1YJ94_9CILI|nr:unnamed protein product [Paramecium pentaurelia]